MAKYKMVRLTPEAYNFLTKLGKKNESYSQLVIRLAEHYEKTANPNNEPSMKDIKKFAKDVAEQTPGTYRNLRRKK
jgi:predicted CopG family antitoxin